MPELTSRAEPQWRLSAPLVGWVAAVVVSTISYSIATAAGADADTVGAYFGGQIGFWGGLLGAVVLASRTWGTGNVRVDFGLQSTRRDAVVGVLAGLATQLVVLPLLYLPLWLFTDDLDLTGPSEDLFDSAGPALLLAFAVIALAPIVEELFFRGLFLGALLTRFGPRAAVILSAVVFGATHFQLLQLPGLVAAGLCFAWLRVTTGRLGSAIWAHAAFNATTVALLYV